MRSSNGTLALEPDLCLRVEVPICAFRPYESREYQDTFPVPPPSSIYGMLLSLCGIRREQISIHRGTAMAIAIDSLPERSKVFRKLRRGKELGDLRPDYQDLLIGLTLWIWLAEGHDRGSPRLYTRVAEALKKPSTINRFGGLSLGESSYLVNAVVQTQPAPDTRLAFLVPDEQSGFYHLPIWVDHAKNQSVRRRFDLKEMDVAEGLATSWFCIGG